jgi:hypothetical protein
MASGGMVSDLREAPIGPRRGAEGTPSLAALCAYALSEMGPDMVALEARIKSNQERWAHSSDYLNTLVDHLLGEVASSKGGVDVATIEQIFGDDYAPGAQPAIYCFGKMMQIGAMQAFAGVFPPFEGDHLAAPALTVMVRSHNDTNRTSPNETLPKGLAMQQGGIPAMAEMHRDDRMVHRVSAKRITMYKEGEGPAVIAARVEPGETSSRTSIAYGEAQGMLAAAKQP